MNSPMTRPRSPRAPTSTLDNQIDSGAMGLDLLDLLDSGDFL